MVVPIVAPVPSRRRWAPLQAWRNRVHWSRSERAEWLALAVDAGLGYLRDQTDEFTRLRDRSILFASFIGTACAFLVSAAVSIPSESRGAWFYAVSISGTAAVAAMVFCVIVITIPRREFSNVLSATLLVDWVQRPHEYPHRRSLEAARARLATVVLPEMTRKNEDVLIRLRRWHIGLLICGTLALAIWGLLVWRLA